MVVYNAGSPQTSQRKMYARPQTLEQALELLAQGPRTILAGGTDYYPGLRDRAPTTAVIDITSIDALNSIVVDDKSGAVRIGALTTWSALVAASLPPAFDALKAAAIEVGSVRFKIVQHSLATCAMHHRQQTEYLPCCALTPRWSWHPRAVSAVCHWVSLFRAIEKPCAMRMN